MPRYTHNDVAKLVEKQRVRIVCRIRLLRKLAGGMKAQENELRSFVQHHLKLAPGTPEFEEAYARIVKEEIGERETTPEGGEIAEEQVYGVNVIRRSERGPYLLEHQIKAMLKQALSRMGTFKKVKYSKGDIAEMGTVLAHGDSLQNPERPWEIYLRNGGKPAETDYDIVRGCVGTPKGKKSIQTHAECAPAGTTLEFEIRWTNFALSIKRMLEALGAASVIGLNSCLSLGYGRFAYEFIETDDAEEQEDEDCQKRLAEGKSERAEKKASKEARKTEKVAAGK